MVFSKIRETFGIPDGTIVEQEDEVILFNVGSKYYATFEEAQNHFLNDLHEWEQEQQVCVVAYNVPKSQVTEYLSRP